MKFEYQINFAHTYDINLDIYISRSVRNGRIDLLSTLTLLVSERMKNTTLYFVWP